MLLTIITITAAYFLIGFLFLGIYAGYNEKHSKPLTMGGMLVHVFIWPIILFVTIGLAISECVNK